MSGEVRALPTIYLDRVFLLNAVIDYLILLTTAQLIGAARQRWKLGIAAALGGGYAAAVFVVPTLQGLLFRILVGILLPIVAFCGQRRLWRHTALFFLLSGALAGLILAVGLLIGKPKQFYQNIYTAHINWWVLLGSTMLFYLLLELLFRHIQQAYLPSCLRIKQKLLTSSFFFLLLIMNLKCFNLILIQVDKYNYIVFTVKCFTNIAFNHTNIATVEILLNNNKFHCAICINNKAPF